MYTFDYPLFLALNFDGGPVMDSVMKTISGTAMWIPMYAAVLGWVWYSKGWKTMLAFLVCAAIAIGCADMFCGIFKHSGLLKHLWESFPPRLRPAHTPELQGLIHIVYRPRGLYGTVSAHAATVAAFALFASMEIRRTWFSLAMTAVTLLICYSRIYLACHFPVDIALGLAAGAIAGGGMRYWYEILVAKIEKYGRK